METENNLNKNDTQLAYEKMFHDWHDNKLTTVLKCKYFVDNNIMTDFTFKIVNDNNTDNDKNLVKCHKLILSIASLEFFNLITIKKESEVIIKNINIDTFKMFINYIYTNEISIERNLLNDILKLSEHFSVLSLKELCWKFIETNITNDTVFEFFELADVYKNEIVLKLCEKYYQQNTEIIIKTQGFLNVHKNLLKVILSIDNLNCTEYELFKAVIVWGNYQLTKNGTEVSSNNLRKEINDLISLIRFNAMEIDEFLSFIQDYKNFFTNDEVYEIMLNFPNKKNPNKDVQVQRTNHLILLNKLKMSVCFRINDIEDCHTLDTYLKKKNLVHSNFFGSSPVFSDKNKQFNFNLQSPSIVSSDYNATKNYDWNVNTQQKYLLKFSSNKEILLKGFGILIKFNREYAISKVSPKNKVNTISYKMCLTESKLNNIIYENEKLYSEYVPKYQYLPGYVIETLFITEDVLLKENTDYILELAGYNNIIDKNSSRKQIEICNNVLFFGNKTIQMENSDMCFSIDAMGDNAKEFDENPIVLILFKGPY